MEKYNTLMMENIRVKKLYGCKKDNTYVVNIIITRIKYAIVNEK